MNLAKMPGLLAVATIVLMAFAAPASATFVTTDGDELYTGTIKAEAEGTTSIDGAFLTVSCEGSQVEGQVESHGESVTAKEAVSTLDFSGCNYTVTVKKTGSLETHATSEGNGTLTSTGAEISIATSVGTCVFTTNGTSIGTLTGSATTAGNATLDINSSSIPRTGGSFLCGSSGTWTGNYKFTSPEVLLTTTETGYDFSLSDSVADFSKKNPYDVTLINTGKSAEGKVAFENIIVTLNSKKFKAEKKCETTLKPDGGSCKEILECIKPDGVGERTTLSMTTVKPPIAWLIVLEGKGGCK